MSRIPVEWIDRYITGVCSAEEREVVQCWLADAPERGVLIDALRNRDGNHTVIAGTQGEDATWARVRRRALASDGIGVMRGARPMLRVDLRRKAHGWSVWPIWRRVGIALAVCVVLGTVGILSKDLWGRRLSRGGAVQHPMTVYATGNGQRATIALPDGTHVVLSVASQLEVPADYVAGNHTVRLRGTALFAVAHRGDVPFTVIAGPSTTRVLGTDFVVRHYATDTVATIAVREGKVAVRSDVVTTSDVVTAGKQAQVGHSGTVRIRAAMPSQFTFAVGVLTVDGLPLSAGVVELERWYDAEIRLADPSLASMHIRGEFTTGSRADLAAMLEWTLNVRVVQDGRVLTLYRK